MNPIGLIAEAIPRTIRKLNTFDPIALPSAIPISFFLAATTDVTNSGNEVPLETIVSPTNVWLIPSSIAILLAELTVRSPPIAIAAPPPMINSKLKNLKRQMKFTMAMKKTKSLQKQIH